MSVSVLSVVCSFTGQIAVCGDSLDCMIKLPFIDFLPETVPYDFFITGEFLEARLYVPETNTSQAILLSLANSARVTNRDGHKLNEPFGNTTKWREHTKRNDGWIDVMTTPILAAHVVYEYYPMYVLTDQSYQEILDTLVTHPDNIPVNTAQHNVSTFIIYLCTYISIYTN